MLQISFTNKGFIIMRLSKIIIGISLLVLVSCNTNSSSNNSIQNNISDDMPSNIVNELSNEKT